MNKIEVLRSDQSVRTNLKLATANKQIPAAAAACDIETEKISTLLKLTDIANTEIASYVSESATADNPDIGSRVNYVGEIPEITHYPEIREVYTTEYCRCVKNNKPLENNYTDNIRGNVICLNTRPPIYQREFDYQDTVRLSQGVPLEEIRDNSHDAYKKFFLITDGINQSRITNPFKGKNLNGAAISFWIKCSEVSAWDNYGLLTILGDYKKQYYDADSAKTDTEFVHFTDHIHVTSMMDVVYDSAFHNTYYRKSNIDKNPDCMSIRKALYRYMKAWMFVTISFQEYEIDTFINGIRVPYFTARTGSDFGKSAAISDSQRSQRPTILDLLTDKDTELFLGTNINDKFSVSMLLDDITFYDSCIHSDEDAMELYKEAYSINLP